jgi:hypothetical protein
MSKIVKKICPVTGADEITIEYPDPNELITTQRKELNGKYRRVSRPRKEVRNALIPKITCLSLEFPELAKIPSSLKKQMMKEKKVWCKKRKMVCPIEQII